MVYFPIVTIVYFLLQKNQRVWWLLAASFYFYMAFIPKYALILVALIVVDYTAGLLIERAQGRKRKAVLVWSLLANLSMLAFFKYFNFMSANASELLRVLGIKADLPYLDFILPIGLSFHTFQSLSYTIEVYLGRQKAERDFLIYSLYVMFYPQLVAGPIERPQNLLPQFHAKMSIDYNNVTTGLRLMLWGLFKKVVIADVVAGPVGRVFSTPQNYANGPFLILAAVMFSVQIFCDFSGYSDIAIGAARVMGFKLMTNFRQPYWSRSVAEFWKRWHISLSTWFRDYVYVQLGGNRVGRIRWQRNLLITFLLSGFWHGANWTYIVWGGLNGLYLIGELWTEGLRRRIVSLLCLARAPVLHAAIQRVITYSLITLAWIFFRAQSLADATFFVRHLFDFAPHDWYWSSLEESLFKIGLSRFALASSGAAMVLVALVHALQQRGSIGVQFGRLPVLVRWICYFGLAFYILFAGRFGSDQFIYFQF
ncbi:alginate O-acetyltransferase [Planctomyces bekefii]|uniref:Alginate O-acetyltransferase n=1 Tax=Planctomyces bekefii TaxID=1653850 RepID=A0A5C6MGP4_9PLAN|nr:alginate O-acetyltransferase [Planctomyces bekefii]